MSDQLLAQPIPGVASPALHRLILFTERLARLTWPGQVAIVAGYTIVITVVWGAALDSVTSGLVIALVALAFILVDWLGLALLPRLRRSFGPVAPGLVLFGGLRCALTVVLALLASEPIIASTVLLGGQLALTGYALDSMWGEPFRLGVTRLTYRSPKLDGSPPLRVLHLTDFHVERLTRREHRVLELIDELRPDLIVYTGDLLSFSYVDDATARAECRALMSQLRAPLGVFAVPGTPLVDTESALEAVLGGLDNIELLRDTVVSLPSYPRLRWIGLNCTHDPSIDGPRLDYVMDSLEDDGFTVLLYHAPDLTPEAARQGIDLVLCGHTHGGQIRLPLVGALFTSSVYWKRYEMGEYREGDTRLYVSRGVGLEGKGMPRMRFLCPPEIELIELRGTVAAEDNLRERAPDRVASRSGAARSKLLDLLRPITAPRNRHE